MLNIQLKQVYGNSVFDIYQSSDSEYLEVRWKAASKELSDNEFKQHERKLAEEVQRHKPRLLFSRTDQLYYNMRDENLKEWIKKEITPKFALSVKRLAMLVNEDVYNQLAMEEASSETDSMQVQYFFSVEDAHEWLFANEPQEQR